MRRHRQRWPPPAGGASAPPAPLPHPAVSDFERIERELRQYDERRETVIKQSRDIQKMSKQARSHTRGGGGERTMSALLPVRRPTRQPSSLACCLQAIFSLHRGAGEEASQRLQAARKAAEGLLPLIAENPMLRQGSFSNAVEE